MNKKLYFFIVYVFLFMFVSNAQEKWMESVRSGLDSVVKGIHQIGSYADEVLRSNLFGVEQSIPYKTERTYENQFPVAQNVNFLISNEFGIVEIKSWNEPVVHISTTLAVGSQEQESLNQVLNEYQPKVINENNVISIENHFPEAKVSYIKVDHVITVPRSASVSVDNFFGDTRVVGIGGNVTLNNQYGAVELENINGNVSVRMQGEFPVKVRRITNGGTFYLSRCVAEFSDISGDMNIYNLLGSVKLQKLGVGRFSLHSDSGRVFVQIDDVQNIDIKGSLLSSTFNTDLSVIQKTTGALNVVNLQNPEATCRLDVSATFSEIAISKTEASISDLTTVISNAKPYSEISTWEEGITSGDVLIINNQKGDIRLLTSEEPKVKVKATRLVWVSSADRAPTMLEKVTANFHRTDNRVYVTSGGNFDKNIDTSFDWRVDVQVFCPVGIEVVIESNDGQTACENIQGSLRVNQSSGLITLSKCKGSYFLSNQKGNIKVEEVEGDGEITIRNGVASLKNVNSPINITAFQSKVNMEDIHARVFGRVQEGDIYFLAMNGIYGDIDIMVEKGNISMLFPPDADCKIKAVAYNGIIDSAIPLTGLFSRTKQEAETQLRDGKSNILLQTSNGDIIIDGNIVENASVSVETPTESGNNGQNQ